MALPLGWGEAALFEPGEAPWSGTGVTRSHDHGGAVLAWRVPAGWRGACDMERRDVDARALAAHLAVPGEGFLERWTAAEVAAKLGDEPIVLRLRRLGLADSTHIGAGAGGLLPVAAHDRVMAFGLAA